MGPQIRVNKYSPGDQTIPDIAAIADDAFVVVWQSADQDGSGLGAYRRIFPADGSTPGPVQQANQTTAGDQYEPAVAGLGGGGVVVWTSRNQDGESDGVYGRKFHWEAP